MIKTVVHLVENCSKIGCPDHTIVGVGLRGVTVEQVRDMLRQYGAVIIRA